MGATWVRRLPVVVLGVAAAVSLAITGAFVVPSRIVPGVSPGVVLAAATGLLTYQVGVAAGVPLAGAAPAFAWLMTALYFGMPRAEGDLVVTGSADGLGFLLLGSASAAYGITRVRGGLRRAEQRAAARAAAAAGAAAEAAVDAGEPDPASGEGDPAPGGAGGSAAEVRQDGTD